MPIIKETNAMSKSQLLEEVARLHKYITALETDRGRIDLNYERLKTEHVKLQQHDSVHRESIRIIGKLHR